MESKDKKLNILVTGVGGPAGINSSRLLQDETGVHVIGCDIDEYSTGRFFVDEFLICPRVSDAAAYEAWIREIVSEHAIDILIPTVHEELPVLRAFSDELSCTVAISPMETLLIGDDKKLMYEWMDAHMPEHVAKWTTLKDWTPEWSGEDEQFIKPRQGRGGRGCRVATPAEISFLKDQDEALDSTLIMSSLPGTEWTVDAYVGQDGRIVYTMVRERMGLAGGISIKGRTAKNQAVIDATREMLGKLSCRGPALIQWKADQDGVPKLVEINPRFSGGLMISRAAGVNPISNIIREHKGETLTEQDWREVTVLGYLDYKVLEN